MRSRINDTARRDVAPWSPSRFRRDLGHTSAPAVRAGIVRGRQALHHENVGRFAIW